MPFRKESSVKTDLMLEGRDLPARNKIMLSSRTIYYKGYSLYEGEKLLKLSDNKFGLFHQVFIKCLLWTESTEGVYDDHRTLVGLSIKCVCIRTCCLKFTQNTKAPTGL